LPGDHVWFEGDTLGTYGKDFASIYNERWARWSEQVWPFLREQVAKHHPGARTWLDLCCGCGALLRFTYDGDFESVGVDLSPHQLRWARKNVPGAQFIREDVRRLRLGRTFDVITCMYDSLNYLRTKRDFSTALLAARRHLADRGILVFDVNTFEGLQDTWCRTSAIHNPKWTIVIETSFDAKKALGRCRITGFVRKGRSYRRFEEEHIERGYRAAEVEDLLARVGLSYRTYDGYTHGRPKRRSARLLHVCTGQAGRP